MRAFFIQFCSVVCSSLQRFFSLLLSCLSCPRSRFDTLILPRQTPGPAESPYEGGTFIVDFVFPADYPFKAPEIKFLTKIYHPNIKTDTGEICADIINSNWAPTLDVMHCLEVRGGGRGAKRRAE